MPRKVASPVIPSSIGNARQGVGMLEHASVAERWPALDPAATIDIMTASGLAPVADDRSRPNSVAPMPAAVTAAVAAGQGTLDLQQAPMMSQRNGSASGPAPSIFGTVASSSDTGAPDRGTAVSTSFPGITAVPRMMSGTQDAVQGNQVRAAIEAAVVPVASKRPTSWLKADGKHPTDHAVALPHQTMSLSLPLPDGGPGYRRDLRQQMALPPESGPSAGTSGGRSLQSNGIAITAASTHGASGGGYGDTAAAGSLLVSLTGAVNLDGRRLGRLTASSQAREASLPSRGPSRVNLRTVPVYSGMQIPS